MKSFILILLAILPVLALGYLAFYSFKKKSQGRPVKKVMIINLTLFVAILAFTSILTFGVSASETSTPVKDGTAQTETTTDNGKGLGLLAAAISTSLAGIGGGIAVAAGAPAAIAATSEDPKAFGKALIFVALGESIALYGVVISILILNKI
jgi:V/A-type H+-transporting ATPase subunit K